MIPRIIHRVWVQTSLVPAPYEQWSASFLELHPGWIERRSDGLATNPPASCCHVRQQSNWARLHILWEHGGLYADWDTEFLRDIEPLLSGATAVASPFYARGARLRACNAFLAAAPHHPWIGRCLDLLKEADPATHLSMGSKLISEALDSRDDVRLLGREDVLQRPFWRRLGRKPDPKWYAVHHFANMDSEVLG